MVKTFKISIKKTFVKDIKKRRLVSCHPWRYWKRLWKHHCNTRIYNLSWGPVLIFPLFSCKSLLWNEQTQRADSRWKQQSYFTTTSINFSPIYFQIGIMLRLNYYQWPNQALLSNKQRLQIQCGFYRHAFLIHFQLWYFVTERACVKNSRKLMPGTWLFGASWWNVTVLNGSCKFVQKQSSGGVLQRRCS